MIARALRQGARSLALTLACMALPAAAQQRIDAGFQVPHIDLRFRIPPTTAKSVPTTETRCEQCHTTAAWEKATFDHEKTGFPLRGAHAGASCKSCHAGDLSEPLARGCAGCHQDPHLGEFGQQCQGCHREDTWVPLFNVDAHRRTNFPLVGRHAFIPCTECHVVMTNRNFGLSTVACLGCHQADYNATIATPVNHIQLQFGTACGGCHTSITWSGARFQAHDACFQIIGGSHGNIQCLACHTSLAGAHVSGTCNTNTAACSSCHAHVCSKMDVRHMKVPGYQCADLKCYACHRIVSSP
jgi:hypothetical protein